MFFAFCGTGENAQRRKRALALLIIARSREDFRVGLTFLLAAILFYLGRVERVSGVGAAEHQVRCTRRGREGGGYLRSLNCVLSTGTRFILAIAPGSTQWKFTPRCSKPVGSGHCCRRESSIVSRFSRRFLQRFH